MKKNNESQKNLNKDNNNSNDFFKKKGIGPGDEVDPQAGSGGDFQAYKKSSNNNNVFWFVLASVLIFYIGTAWGKSQTDTADGPTDKFSVFMEELSNPKSLLKNTEEGKPEKVDFGVFWDTWNELDKSYIDKESLKTQERVYGAVEGMVKAAGDPYTNFMTPEETEDFNTDMEGSFEGIGAEIGVREEVLTIIAPISGMPAEKAGLKAGDKVIEINGESASDLNVDEAVEKIRGPKGSKVTLSILREGESETQNVEIIRDEIDLKSVRYEKKEDGIAYVQIANFSEDTSAEFNKEITKVIADDNKGIVLDLRNNPGGYLNIAVEMASKFIPRGELVVQERKSNGKVDEFKALGGANLEELPVVVLINEGSASASEILAGALRDQKESLLVGEKSFGKGSVQQLKKLKDGSSLKVTIAEWLTPNGDSINEEGLNPDIKVEITKENIEDQEDVQLERALEEIRKKINQ
ncbi:MAG: S41 family peptidase [Patescibacteria group bacterium]